MSDTHVTELSENPVYAFCPVYASDDQVQQICIVFRDIPGFVATEIAAPDLAQAEDLCDRLNRALGHDRDAWMAIAAQSISRDRPAGSMN